MNPTCDPIVSTLVEALNLREAGREWRGNDPRFSRIAYRLARNRLAALRRGEPDPTRWWVELP